MIPPAKIFCSEPFVNFISVEAAAAASTEGFIQMINTLRRSGGAVGVDGDILFAVATPAFSQAPTDAQRSAIRSAMPRGLSGPLRQRPAGRQGVAAVPADKTCRASHPAARPRCAPSSPSDAESRGVGAPAAPSRVRPGRRSSQAAAETAAPPAAAKTLPAPKAAASAAAKKPSSAQIAAIRSACRSDYQQNCAGVPTGGAAALSCLEKNKANLSANCQKAVNAAGGGAGPACGGARRLRPAAG